MSAWIIERGLEFKDDEDVQQYAFCTSSAPVIAISMQRASDDLLNAGNVVASTCREIMLKSNKNVSLLAMTVQF